MNIVTRDCYICDLQWVFFKRPFMEMKEGNITEVHAASYVGSVAVLRGTCRGENGGGRYKSDLCARYLHDHFLFAGLVWFLFHHSCFRPAIFTFTRRHFGRLLCGMHVLRA